MPGRPKIETPEGDYATISSGARTLDAEGNQGEARMVQRLAGLSAQAHLQAAEEQKKIVEERRRLAASREMTRLADQAIVEAKERAPLQQRPIPDQRRQTNRVLYKCRCDELKQSQIWKNATREQRRYLWAWIGKSYNFRLLRDGWEYTPGMFNKMLHEGVAILAKRLK
jgi:hypothetical protein